MAQEKQDRRIRKTRALLQKGLIELMETKEIQNISVKELADLTDINRGTFYLHYADVYDMLHKMEEELFAEFNDILEHNLSKDGEKLDTHKRTLTEIFSFLEHHYDLARVMIGPRGDLAFVNRLKNLVKERLQHLLPAPREAGEYYYAFLLSGCVGVIETWLNSPSPLPAEDMAELCSHMLGSMI